MGSTKPQAKGLEGARGALCAEEPKITPEDLARITRFAHEAFGLYLPPNKASLVETRLQRLLRRTGCQDFATFIARIESGHDGAERQGLISALTTNVTHFYREAHHFDLLHERLLKPALIPLKRGQRLRIWSAGCSAGHEPCSIALTILRLLPDTAGCDIRILATDLDPQILACARQGEYAVTDLEPIAPPLRERYFLPGSLPSRLRAGAEIRRLIQYQELNLVTDWPMRGPFDAIFCRNVAIYFDKPTQARLWSRLAGLLAPEGLLFIGHSERVAGPASAALESLGMTSYRKRPSSETSSKPEARY